jgi:hypothetical protein
VAGHRLRLTAFKEATERLLEMGSKHFEVSFPINLDARNAPGA